MGPTAWLAQETHRPPDFLVNIILLIGPYLSGPFFAFPATFWGF